MANARHEMILQLIQKQDISTQEMLRDLLEQNGFSVTQATISRDIRQLKLRKRRTASGLSCYAKAPTAPAAPTTPAVKETTAAKPASPTVEESAKAPAETAANGIHLSQLRIFL